MSNPLLPPSPCQIHLEQKEHGRNAALSDGSAPSQGTAVSALTTDSSFVDLPVDSGEGGDTTAILGLIPSPTCMQDAVDQLMIIFKQRARAANDSATAQRVLRERAQAERAPIKCRTGTTTGTCHSVTHFQSRRNQ